MVATAVAFPPEQTQQLYTLEEYLDMEEKSAERHAFHNGKIIKMAGGTIKHNRVCRNILSILDQELGQDYEAFGSDQKIYIPKYNFYFYPDAVVVSEEPIVTAKGYAITNPILIVEVLSPSTEEYDRGKKFIDYTSIPSFKEYVLIRQDAPEIQTFFREEHDLWRKTETEGLEQSVFFKSLNISILLSRIYKKVF